MAVIAVVVLLFVLALIKDSPLFWGVTSADEERKRAPGTRWYPETR